MNNELKYHNANNDKVLQCYNEYNAIALHYPTGNNWIMITPVWTLLVAPLWYDLGLVPNSCGNKAAANLHPTVM